MKFKIIAVGKCKDNNLLNLIEGYRKRMQNRIEIIEVKNSSDASSKFAGYYPILLDEKGKRFDSMGFANFLKYKSENESSKIAFCIGGAEGHTESMRAVVKEQISLSDMTLPHMLVRLVLIEQLYRAETIIAGHPYHREG